MANRLVCETSPYLLQHANNPVDWYPWSADALATAQRLNKPILLSVGYAACHWCHVMAHESFEDPQTAAVMNDLFINVKVDREERPDIDQIYMTALQLSGQRGGWPLTMFLTPAAEPIWGGTYFPKHGRYGRPSFTDVLLQFAKLFREEPDKIGQLRADLLHKLTTRDPLSGSVSITINDLDSYAHQLLGMMDPENGGLRGAPKFPQPGVLEMLWRAGVRTGDQRFFDLIALSLGQMCRGGIYDHLGGGFARYAVDDRWLVPHFEKMLNDNAQLIELLALEYLRTGRASLQQIVSQTVTWLAREMTTAEGAFATSLDADSQGEEGRFYVWSSEEISTALGEEDAAFFALHYDVRVEGNFEKTNILNRLSGPITSDAEEARLAVLRAELLNTRQKRPRPNLDDKILADWNGLMIAALVNAGTIFDKPDWIILAKRAFEFVSKTMTKGDRFGHSWRVDRLLFPGLASDFAAMIRAALTLFERSGDQEYLAHALAWQCALDRHYADRATGGYFLTADTETSLVLRPRGTTDDSTPNYNGLIAQNLIRLAVLTGDVSWREKADRLFDCLLPNVASDPFGHVALLNALDFRLRAAEIIVTGRKESELATAALKIPFIERVVLRASSTAALPPSHPAQEKLRSAPEGAAFICIDQTCSLPVRDDSQIAQTIGEMRNNLF